MPQATQINIAFFHQIYTDIMPDTNRCLILTVIIEHEITQDTKLGNQVFIKVLDYTGHKIDDFEKFYKCMELRRRQN